MKLNLSCIDKITIEQCESLAEGSFGQIYRVTEIALNAIKRLQVDMALKAPKPTQESRESIASEIRFLHEFHRRLNEEDREKVFPDVLEVVFHDEKSYLMERYTGDLHLNTFSIEEKIQIAAQLIEQIALFSKYRVIYTDYKLSNVLFKNEKAVFADFGNCHFVDMRSSIPRDGFAKSLSKVCEEEYSRLFRGFKSASDEELKNFVDQHHLRGLGLLLTALFHGEDTPFVRMYSVENLTDYIKMSDPLKSLRDQNGKHHDIIRKMLLEPAKYSPELAWREWSCAV